MTQPVDIPLYGRLTKKEYTKEELLKIWQQTQDEFNMRIATNQKLLSIVRLNGHFELRTDQAKFTARNVVLALGRRGTPRKLGVPGEDKAKVFYKLMDAESYSNEHLLVVGGGDSAVEAAMGLAQQQGNTVTISYRKPKFFRLKTRNEERIAKLIREGKIRVEFESSVLEIGETEVRLQLSGGEATIPNDYVFIFAGGEPPFKLLKDIGIAFGAKHP
jgi:thioredoxin reductase